MSDLSFPVGVADNLLLRDPARGDWPVPILIHYPIGATDQRPVVIWNHGGAPSAGGKNRSEEWGRALAAAGYIVIHPSRVPVDDVTPFQAQCDAEGLAEEPQKQGKPLLGPLAGYRSLRAVGATLPDPLSGGERPGLSAGGRFGHA